MVKCCSVPKPSVAVGEVHFLGRWHRLLERFYRFYVKVFSISFPLFYPLLPSLSAERRQSSAEGMPLPGGRPARISDGVFRSLWGGSSGGILRPLAQLQPSHGGGREAIAAFLGLNLKPASEKPRGKPVPTPSASSFPQRECSSLQKLPALYKIGSGWRNARMRK